MKFIANVVMISSVFLFGLLAALHGEEMSIYHMFLEHGWALMIGIPIGIFLYLFPIKRKGDYWKKHRLSIDHLLDK